MSNAILIRPKQTAVREAWQWTGQPRNEWPAWVSACCDSPTGGEELRLRRRSGSTVVFLDEWLVRDLDSADVIQYTDAELWEEFERS